MGISSWSRSWGKGVGTFVYQGGGRKILDPTPNSDVFGQNIWGAEMNFITQASTPLPTQTYCFEPIIFSYSSDFFF